MLYSLHIDYFKLNFYINVRSFSFSVAVSLHTECVVFIVLTIGLLHASVVCINIILLCQCVLYTDLVRFLCVCER